PLGWGAEGRALLSLALTLALLPPVYLFLVYGVPRLLVRQQQVVSESDLPGYVRPFLGLVGLLSIFSRLFYLVFGGLFPHRDLSKSDLLALVTDLEPEEEEEEENGETVEEEETDEEELVYNILDLEDTLVREVMRPINSVDAIPLGRTTVEDVKDLARRTGHSRFPVYRERIVDLVGYVNIYDILSNGEEKPLPDYVSPPYFVPEFMRVSDLLQQFLRKSIQVAIVVDEYGGCSGWVTREDVLEEIVGEIEDEFDTIQSELTKLDDGAWLSEGSIDIDDLAAELPIEFDEEAQYDTLAGLLLDSLGHIPAKGEKYETADAVFRVERMEKNRIARVRITLRNPDQAQKA
ncbi:HlyC/CorC family transporter, partial [bacterium]|nr:HlyC/CorC family transporter [bacterium]